MKSKKNKRIALVTGVSRLKGIGKAICIELAQSGIDIFFTYWLNYDRSMPWSVEDNEPERIQQEIESYRVSCAKGRIGRPMDAAKLISFLTTEEASWITGQIINSEGGFIRERYQ